MSRSRFGSPSRVPAALLGLLAVVLAACGPASATAFTATDLGGSADGWRGIPLEVDPPRELPDVTLQGTDGQDVALSDFAGKPTLLFFGYTSCPDICPIHLATIASAMSTMGVSREELDLVFVSVDPERDTPERIEDFVTSWEVPFTGLRGDLEVVQQALDALDLPGPVVEGADPRGDGELIGHPAQVIGFDADGVAQRVWPFGARRADWVNDIPRILDDWTVDGGASALEGLPTPVTEAGRVADRLDGADGGHGSGS